MMTHTDRIAVREALQKERPSPAECARLIAIATAERTDLLDIQREIAALLPEPGAWLDRDAQQRVQDARADLTYVNHGVDHYSTPTNPRLAARRGLPGLAELDRTIVRLQEKHDREAARLAVEWPRAFTFAGRYGDHLHSDGRLLRPGDVVELTEVQAESWGDRFEPVAG